MENVLTWVITHWADIAQALGLLVAAASLITGLTPTPADDRFVAKVKYYLRRLSILTHKDESGTFKLPGKS